MVEITAAGTALIGMALQALVKFFTNKFTQDAESDANASQSAANVEAAKVQLEIEKTRLLIEQTKTNAAINAADREAESKNADSAYKHDSSSYAPGINKNTPKIIVWLEFIRGIMRPYITFYSNIAITAIAAYMLFHTPIAQLSAADIAKELVDAIKFIAIMSTTWWFGQRYAIK